MKSLNTKYNQDIYKIMCFNFIAFKWDVLTEEGGLKVIKVIREELLTKGGSRKEKKQNGKDTKLKDFTDWKER